MRSRVRLCSLVFSRIGPALAVLLAMPPVAEATGPGVERAARLIARPDVSAALRDVDERLERFVAEWIRIAEIPAPSGAEQARAAHLERHAARRGWSDTRRDDAGNVIIRVRGADPTLPAVAFLAHMDTVASKERDHSVRRAGDRLWAPGVRDDSSGVAGLLAVLDLLETHGLKPPADTYFVATVREETGLHGADRFVSAHADRLGAVIAVDGHLGQISHGATGILWLELHFLAAGAHTLSAHDEPSAILAAARAIERISAIPQRRSPEPMETWINIGVMGGGDVPNAQARDAWFTVDIRSNDVESFGRMEQRILEIGRSTAREIGVTFEHRTLHRMAGGRIAGSEDSPLVVATQGILRSLGWDSVDMTVRGTADHNVAVLREIPGVAIGVTTGGAAHTPEEYADIPPFSTGIKQLLLLSLFELTGPPHRPTEDISGR